MVLDPGPIWDAAPGGYGPPSADFHPCSVPRTFIHPPLTVRKVGRPSALTTAHLRGAVECCAPTLPTACTWRWRRPRRQELTVTSESFTSGEQFRELLLTHGSPCPLRVWLEFRGLWVGASSGMSYGNRLPVCAPLFDCMESPRLRVFTFAGGWRRHPAEIARRSRVFCDRPQDRKFPAAPGSLLHCEPKRGLPLPRGVGSPRNGELVCAMRCGDRRGGFPAFSPRLVVGLGLRAFALLVACRAATAGFCLNVGIMPFSIIKVFAHRAFQFSLPALPPRQLPACVLLLLMVLCLIHP